MVCLLHVLLSTALYYLQNIAGSLVVKWLGCWTPEQAACIQAPALVFVFFLLLGETLYCHSFFLHPVLVLGFHKLNGGCSGVGGRGNKVTN